MGEDSPLKLLGYRIAGARMEAGLTQAALAQAAGVKTVQTVGNWEAGRSKPDLPTLELIAAATGRALSYFVGHESQGGDSQLAEQLSRTERVLAEIRAREAATGVPYPVVELPVLGAVAAGRWEEALESTNETHAIPASEFPPDMQLDRAFLLRVQGDSMINEGIKDNDLILVHPTTTYRDGAVVVVANGGTATVKYVYAGDGSRPLLVAANPAYPPLPLPEGSRIIGTVRGVHRTYPPW